MIRLTCPMCRAALTVGDHWAGRSAECPKCNAALRVPPAEPSPSAPPVHLIGLICPSCGRELSVPAGDRGKQCKCPSCGDTVRIPGPREALEASAKISRPRRRNDLAWWSFFTGAMSLAFCAPLGICALCLGFLSRKKESPDGYATAGIILGGISTVLWGAATIAWMIALAGSSR